MREDLGAKHGAAALLDKGGPLTYSWVPIADSMPKVVCGLTTFWLSKADWCATWD